MDRSPLVIPLWVAAGAAIGGLARYWCSGVVAHAFRETFPWGTLVVNVVGSTLIGSALVTLERVEVIRYGKRDKT